MLLENKIDRIQGDNSRFQLENQEIFERMQLENQKNLKKMQLDNQENMKKTQLQNQLNMNKIEDLLVRSIKNN